MLNTDFSTQTINKRNSQRGEKMNKNSLLKDMSKDFWFDYFTECLSSEGVITEDHKNKMKIRASSGGKRKTLPM